MFKEKSECDYLCTRVTVSTGIFVAFISVPVAALVLIYWLGGGDFERGAKLGLVAFISVALMVAGGLLSLLAIAGFNDWLTSWLEKQLKERKNND